MNLHGHTLIIGAGLAGLTAAWQLAAQGKKVRLIAKGWGSLYWHTGCIDVLGYYPLANTRPLDSPLAALPQFTADNPHHPYALIPPETLDESLRAFQSLCAQHDYPLAGTIERNWLLPSAVGAIRPTCLAPETMTAGDLRQTSPMLIAGFSQLLDFYPHLIADNLTAQGIPAEAILLNLFSLGERNFLNTPLLAKQMEQPEFRAELVAALRPHLGKAERIGFPAVLGQTQAIQVKQELEKQLGRPIFEIPSLPPSVPGMRLHQILTQAISDSGGQLFDGMQVVGATAEGNQITAVYSEAAARTRPHRFDHYVLATGGILGGGIHANDQGQLREAIFDLPLAAPPPGPGRTTWFNRNFLHPEGHPIYQAGIAVNANLQPTAPGSAEPVYENLYAAGTTLAHCDPIRERSLEGIALATAYHIAQLLL